MTVSSTLYKPLKKHEQGTGTYMLTLFHKIVRVTLVSLKLRRGVPGPPIQTSFCVGKKFVWLQYSWMGSSKSTKKGRSLFDFNEARWT